MPTIRGLGPATRVYVLLFSMPTMYSIKGAGTSLRVYVSRGLFLSMPIMYSIKGAGNFSSSKQRFPLTESLLTRLHCKVVAPTNSANLIEGNSKSPHIRGGRELASCYALNGHPFQGQTTSRLLHIHLLQCA